MAPYERGSAGLSFSYCAPSSETGENSPDRFLHLTLLYGDDSEGTASYSRLEGGGDEVVLGDRRGELHYAPAEHQGHVVFFWRENGQGVAISMHEWGDREEALDLLDRIVAALTPVGPPG